MAETIFHKIIKREIPADIVYEDKECIAFRDINPVSKTHLLIVPKKTVADLNQLQPGDKEMLGHLLLVATKLAEKEGIKDNGYRLVINCGENAGQTVFQLHMHLLGGRTFGWPPG